MLCIRDFCVYYDFECNVFSDKDYNHMGSFSLFDPNLRVISKSALPYLCNSRGNSIADRGA